MMATGAVSHRSATVAGQTTAPEKIDMLSGMSWALGRFAPAVMLKVFAFFTFFYLVYVTKLDPRPPGWWYSLRACPTSSCRPASAS